MSFFHPLDYLNRFFSRNVPSLLEYNIRDSQSFEKRRKPSVFQTLPPHDSHVSEDQSVKTESFVNSIHG